MKKLIHNAAFKKAAGTVTIILIVIIAGILIVTGQKNVTSMSYNDFLKHIENEDVSAVEIQTDGQYFYTWLTDNPDISYAVSHPRTDTFTEYLLLHDIPVTYGSDAALPPAAQILVIAGTAGIAAYIFRRRQSAFSGRFQPADATRNPAATYHLDDIAGNIEAKHMVQDVISFIKTPEKYSSLGARMPRGMLFYGPPGTGKTLMAKAIAGEAGVPFYAISGSDMIETYVGVGARRVRDLFSKAKKSEKAVIFIDEIDAIGKKRGANLSASNDERDQTLNALLTEMSGFHEREGIVIIAATNRADVLDDALLRPGRFDRQIEIGLPDYPARLSILSLHAKDKPLSDTVNLAELAKSTVGFSGASLGHLINEAAILAANEQAAAISATHLDQAFYTVIAGTPKSDRSMLTRTDMELTAYHEAGHALMTKMLLPDHTVSKVTIIPSTHGAGGFSMSIPKESSYMRKQEIEAHIKVLLAGRAAEELRFGVGQITTGAGNDIEKATRLINEYIYKYGMDDEYGIYCNADAATSSGDDSWARNRLNTFYLEAKEILSFHRTTLEAVTGALLERETLGEQDLDEIIGER